MADKPCQPYYLHN